MIIYEIDITYIDDRCNKYRNTYEEYVNYHQDLLIL